MWLILTIKAVVFLVLRKVQQNYEIWKCLFIATLATIATLVPTLVLDKETYDFLSKLKNLSNMANFTEHFSWEEVNIFITWFLSLSSESLKNIDQRKLVLDWRRLCSSTFFNKVLGWRPAALLKKDSSTNEFFRTFKNKNTYERLAHCFW